jgi:hypothetical protein
MVNKTHAHSSAVSPLFQFVLIIASALLMTVALYRGIISFTTFDVAPPMEIVSPQKLIEFGGSPGIAKVGLYIDQFQTFDMVKNEFIFSGSIWFQFVPGIISLNTLEKFEFARGQILYRSAPDTMLLDQYILVKYNIRVSFTSDLNYTCFPIDDHRIFLMLIHHFVSPNELLFESTQQEFIILPDTTIFGWTELNRTVTTGYLSEVLDSNDARKTHQYPVTLFALDYARSGVRYIITILLPLLLIFYLTLFSLSLDEKAAITLSTGSITAIIAYRFVIENISPAVGYLMISDYLFFLFLACSFLVFFLNTIEMFTERVPVTYKQIAVCVLHLTVSSFTTYMFMFFA